MTEVASANQLAWDRLLVVGNEDARRRSGVLDAVDSHDSWNVTTVDSILSGIADLSLNPARAVVACVNAAAPDVGAAVAGLREAAGERCRLVLCSPPEHEPIVRRAAALGADEYVVAPVSRADLQRALGIGCIDERAKTERATVSMEELSQIGASLSRMNESPGALLDRLVDLVRVALRTRSAQIVVQGTVAESGGATRKPVLTSPIMCDGESIGQLTLGEPTQDPYTPNDVEKLSTYASLIGNILAVAKTQRTLQSLAITDECSNLPNRRYVRDRLEEILEQASREQFGVTVLLFDIDNFKTYNDRFGHAAGDEIIRKTGELFRKSCRKQDIVARYGGDEFLVVFWDASGPRSAGSKPLDEALVVVDRFRNELEAQSFETNDGAINGCVTISGGLASFPWDAGDVDSLLAKADEALLTAKRAGKNRVIVVGEGGA